MTVIRTDSRNARRGSTPRVYWLLRGSYEIPSSRIHGHQIHKQLKRQGWHSVILVNPLHWLPDVPLTPKDISDIQLFRRGDIVIFQKLKGPATADLMKSLAAIGVITVFLDCDLPLKLREASQASWVACSSQVLAREYEQNGIREVIYIPDAVEYFCRPQDRLTRKSKLRCVWFGAAPPKKWEAVEYLRKIMSSKNLADVELVTVSDHAEADIKWNRRTAWMTISECDAAVIPSTDEPWALAKSANRATQSMALGLPVVAYPIPAYEEVIRDGWNGFLCRDDNQWIAALRKLRNEKVRQRMAINAYKYAADSFSIARIGSLWADFLIGLFEGDSSHGDRVPNAVSLLPRVLQERRMQARAYSRIARYIARHREDTRFSIRYASYAFKTWPFDGELYKAFAISISRWSNRAVQSTFGKHAAIVKGLFARK